MVLQIAFGQITLSVGMMILSPHISGLVLARILVGISVAVGISTGSSLLMELIISEQDKNVPIGWP